MTSSTWTVPDFDPTSSGLHFKNDFASAPLTSVDLPELGTIPLGNAANGLCGGMAFTVRDLFEAGRTPPPNTSPPVAGTGALAYLIDRLIDSLFLPEGALRYYEWMALPDLDAPGVAGLGTRTRSEARQLQFDLALGRLCPLGLVRVHSADPRALGVNHQVLAWRYDQGAAAGRDLVHVWDPNHPDADTTLAFDATPKTPLNLTYSTLEPTRGFFVTPYEATDPTPFFAIAGTTPSALALLGRVLAGLLRRRAS